MNVEERALWGKKAARELARASTEQKNRALQLIGELLQKKESDILESNQQDLTEAKKAGLSEAILDRLSLQNRIPSLCAAINQVIALEDPVGEIFEEQKQGALTIKKCRTPIGLLGIIYESRPNVTIDCSLLALKSGNCAILRGGSESFRTNTVLVALVQEALQLAHLPIHAIQLLSSSDRTEVEKMLHLHQYIDVIIPRGGASLHRFCREHSTIPVITGGVGVCHLFMDDSADWAKSLEVIANAKTQRPTVCNALDTLLVHEAIAKDFIPQVIHFLEKKGVTFRLDEVSYAMMKTYASCHKAAEPADWDTEWLSLVLGIKIVSGIAEAIHHIATYSTGHSDGILTEDAEHAKTFMKEVDSAAVYWNASTRFTDGEQFGLGGEVAISTQKLHARGPMGLKELTSYKWVVSGEYTTRK